MDSEEDYDYEMDAHVPTEQGYTVGNEEIRREKANSPFSSENGDDYDDPPVLFPIHAMDIHSVRRPPVPVMVPADRVSTHDLQLAETLSIVERGLFYICTHRVVLLGNLQSISSSLERKCTISATLLRTSKYKF